MSFGNVMLSCRVVRTVDSLTLVGLNPTPVHWHRRIKRKRRERLADNGLTPRYEGPAALAARIERDRKQWREVILSVNVRAE